MENAYPEDTRLVRAFLTYRARTSADKDDNQTWNANKRIIDSSLKVFSIPSPTSRLRKKTYTGWEDKNADDEDDDW